MYHVINIEGRPRLAIPSGSRALRRAAIASYRPTTMKLAGIRAVFRIAAALGLDSLMTDKCINPLGTLPAFDMEGWMEHINSRLGKNPLRAVIVWPPQRIRSRIYVYLIDSQDQLAAFAKLSFDEHNDKCFRNEARALLAVGGLNSLVRQPVLLDYGTFNNRTYIIMEAVSEEARPARLADRELLKITASYAGPDRFIGHSELQTLEWWNALMSFSNCAPSFVEQVKRDTGEGLHVCRVHGDLASHNLAQDKNHLWLLDWEHSSENGPRLTDHLSIWLANHSERIRRYPVKALQELSKELCPSASAKERRDLIAALGFLCASGYPTAVLLAKHWPPESPAGPLSV